MKKGISLLVAIVLLIYACSACAPASLPPRQTTTTNAFEDDKYLQLTPRPVNAYKEEQLAIPSSAYTLSLFVPQEWCISVDEYGMFLQCDDQLVGEVFVGTDPCIDEWTAVATTQVHYDTFSAVRYIEKYGTGSSLKFRYRFSYIYNEDAQREITLTASYEALSSMAADKLLSDVKIQLAGSNPRLNVLSGLQGGDLLILGNSFIGSSQVGTILKHMISNAGKGGTVTAHSRGYASVLTYISDAYLMQSIRAGAYDGIFICGFYDANEVHYLGILKDACDESGTELVVFPAHNENAKVIGSALSTYDTLACLNWKGEIDKLIEWGVDQWDMCIDDMHKHSTALAGYVGAQMIYRAIYGEIPLPAAQLIVPSYELECLPDMYLEEGRIPGRGDEVKEIPALSQNGND